MQNWKTAIVLLVALAAAGACSRESSEEGASEAASEPAADGSGVDTTRAGVRARIALTGGQDAGVHEASPKGSACIPYQDATINGLGIAYYAEDATAPGLAQIDFGTKTRVPTAAPTDSFGFKVVINQHVYQIRPAQQLGTGKATVTGSGPRYTAKVTGKTAEGVDVDATLECLQ